MIVPAQACHRQVSPVLACCSPQNGNGVAPANNNDPATLMLCAAYGGPRFFFARAEMPPLAAYSVFDKSSSACPKPNDIPATSSPANLVIDVAVVPFYSFCGWAWMFGKGLVGRAARQPCLLPFHRHALAADVCVLIALLQDRGSVRLPSDKALEGTRHV